MGSETAQPQSRNERPAARLPPLQLRNMKDTKRKSEHDRRRQSRGQEIEDALERSMPSYTPEHRRAVLKGLRILARVAIRSYMEEQADVSSRLEATEYGADEED